ncbi:UDP-N-acetylglucosamine 2-epimerase (non-hydrolyzing) [Candidatus Woesearchaeota archaeon]|nr:MAG: UDP-N-acetylglucosamine 2-epimerase (non-hydrolyzing) [Candidatus Woesearchaeota archaeon]
MDEELQDKICVVIGTRPGIIKQAPIIEALKELKADFFVLHTGQHYSYNMDKVFFEDLGLPEPEYKIPDTYKYKLHGEQTAKMLMEIERILIRERPKIVVVTGDANTNLAGALAAKKLHMRVAHTESGLRTFDWRVPEEHNRLIIERLGDYLFAPNELARKNLEIDNVGGEIFVVGSTLVDALEKVKNVATRKSTILEELGLNRNEYFLMTMHREENLDYEREIRSIIKGVLEVTRRFGFPIVFPAHPRTIKRLKELGLYKVLDKHKNVLIMPAVGYMDFMALLSNARLVLTDSGGVQQEACILRVPCITLLRATEWVETLLVGANVLVGSDPMAIVKGVELMLASRRNWPNPFGERGVGKRIVKILLDRLHEPIEQVYERYRARRKKVEKYLSLGNWEKVLKALREETSSKASQAEMRCLE